MRALALMVGFCKWQQQREQMVACTRDAVSKEMASFEREGHIETGRRDKKIVFDRGRLGELVEAA